MGAPVQLDFSKAVPIADDGAVKLDFSKAVPLEKSSQPADATTTDAPPKPSGVSRFLSSAWAPIKSAATGLYEAAVEGPQNPEEAHFVGEGQGEDPSWAAGPFRHPLLMAKRMFIDPAKQQAEEAKHAFIQSAPTSLHPTYQQLANRQLAVGHALAAAIPGVGPWAAQVGQTIGEQAGTGDIAGASGTIAGNAALVLAPKVGGALLRGSDAIPRVLRPLVEKTREAQKAATESADEYANELRQNTEDIRNKQAKETADASEKARDAKQLQDQALEEYNRTLKFKTEEITKEQEAARTTAKAKLEEAKKAQDEALELYRSTLRKNTEETAAKQAKERLAAKAKGIEQERAHQKSVEETKAANKAAIREQEKIAPTKEKLQKSVQEMQAQVETARNNALKEGNKKYSAVNAALNHISADPEFMQGALADSLEAIKGTSTEPTILKDMMRKVARGEVATYEDLQGYYSELGTEISKGNVPGDLYHAYDTIHEAIGDEMQRIADANGQGPQLKAARDYWRRMKQAFGKQYNPTDTGNAVLRNTAGDVMRRSQEANQLRLLGSFDKTIPQTAEHIENLQKGIDALPKEQPLRSILKFLPEKPAPVLPPKFEGSPEELARQKTAIPKGVDIPEEPKFEGSPEDLARQSTPLPKGVEMPSPPKFEGSPEELAKQQTKLPKPVGKAVIDKADIEEAKRGRLQKDTDLVRTKGAFGATVLSLYALRSLLHGELGPLGSVPFDVGGALAVTHGVARMMERPSVVSFFTKATAKDIASIPPELRGDLPQLVSAARKSGVKVSPAIAAAAGAASAPKKTPGDILRQAQ